MSTSAKKLKELGSNPKVTAKAAGLRYALQSDKGYYRKRKGSGFTYIDHEGKTVTIPPGLEQYT